MFVFTAAVLGAGTMGAEIACAIADADIPVVLKDEPIGSEEAYAFGLANRVVPDHELLDTALAWAPLPVGHIKRASAAGDLDAGIAAEQAGFAATFGSADGREGIAAFLAKRVPRWTGA